MFCSTSTTVVPLCLMRSTTPNTVSAMTGASPSEASSMSSTRGWAIMARPMASICCSPPDMVPASWPSRSLRRGKYSKTWSIIDPMPTRFVQAPSSRLSRTLSAGNT